MISYSPFWQTIKEKNVTTYTLIKKYNISNSTLCRMRRNKPMTTTKIDDFCKILNCKVENIIEYIAEEKKEP